MLKQFCTAFALAGVLSACGQSQIDSAVSDAGPADTTIAAAISASRIRAHIEFLADDLMEGREAGTSGYDLAARYVVSQFRLLGLEPAGVEGGYFQPIRFITSRLAEGSATLSIEGKSTQRLVFKTDFVSGGGYGEISTSVTAPLVFVGFGVTAPELGYDDFAGIDVAGKIAVMLSGAPAHFPTDQRAFYSSGAGKRERLADHGAVATIAVRTPVDEKRFAWERIALGSGSKGMRWLQPNGNPWHGFTNFKGNVLLSRAGAEKLFADAPQTLENIFARAEAGETNSFDMGISATLERSSEQTRVQSANVIGLLEGSDPELINEYVVFTAHLDHIGIRPSKTDDKIHNGAYDNATGVAIMLETARAIAAMPVRPRRSIIFLAVTAEEKGLLGSEYFARNPTVPIGSIIANVNIDMPVLDFESTDIIAFGAEHSTLNEIVSQAAASEGMSLAPDPYPEEVIFIRSDQYRFIQQGVPAVALWPGLTARDTAIDGAQVRGGFMANHYHQPSDDISLPFNDAAAERFARINFKIGLELANRDARPLWIAGDFFGAMFGPDRMAHEPGSGDVTVVQE